MRATAGEVGVNSLTTFSKGIQHVGTQVLADQQKITICAI